MGRVDGVGVAGGCMTGPTRTGAGRGARRPGGHNGTGSVRGVGAAGCCKRGRAMPGAGGIYIQGWDGGVAAEGDAEG